LYTDHSHRAFSSILDNDRNRHGLDASEEIPDVSTATTDAAISYQADIDETIDARHGVPNAGTAASGAQDQVQSHAEGADK
jgi:hypothetical protein